VVGDSREVLVYFPRFEKERPVVEAVRYLRNYPAVTGHVLATDAARDLALVRLDAVPDGVQALPLADESCGPGEDIHSIGNSGVRGDMKEGTLWWYTRGSVRQVHRRKVESAEGVRNVWFVETQAPVNEGDSGGPVVDAQGRLVGVTDSYSEGERLVSQNIDVREVRTFLRENRAARVQRAAEGERLSPVGGWKFAARNRDGKSLEGDGEFRADGTFALARGDKPLEGRYAFVNGVLWLIADDGFATVKPSWNGKDQFSVKVGKVEMTFDRRPAKTAEVSSKP